MSPRLLFLAVFLIAGCAHREIALPTCAGETRRPANPYGSILTPAGVAPTANAVAAPRIETRQTGTGQSEAPETTGPTAGGCA